MNCPKCGKENPDQFCKFCNSPLTPPPTVSEKVNVRISRTAIASLVCALCALAFSLPGLVSVLEPRILSPKSNFVSDVACMSVLIGGVAFLLGVIALCRIGSSGGRVTGYGFAAIGAVIPPILFFVLLSFNIGGKWHATISPRVICGTNLSSIGKAMLIYSNDYDDEFPRAGGKNSIWSNSIPDWSAENRFTAYGVNADGTGGRATISSSLYLLVKYSEVTPKSFLCKDDTGVTEFNHAKYGAPNKDLIDLWDFGPEPIKHYSYSYHMPYGPYPLTTSSEPGMAVAADRNPWMMSPDENTKSSIAYFDPDGDKVKIRVGNSTTHRGDGQNVLFMDSHVSFE
ncbi:MAG: zinc ribbon domain-containing protein [Planctomycetes bacterium]|nr:zinc ribbon domain-containing protein [Planctomycetota bacterium]